MTHPSFFALDAHLLDPRPGELETHLATCARCQAHLAAARVTVAPPAFLAGLAGPPAASWWRWLVPGLAALASLVLLVVAWAPREAPLLTAKGTPTFVLWLNRDGRVTAWNGQPVRAGDTVRVEVVPAGFTHLTVFDERTREVLYEAKVAEGSSLTPAWRLDGATSDSLRVVLSRHPVGGDALQAACVTDSSSHCARFSLPRESP